MGTCAPRPVAPVKSHRIPSKPHFPILAHVRAAPKKTPRQTNAPIHFASWKESGGRARGEGCKYSTHLPFQTSRIDCVIFGHFLQNSKLPTKKPESRRWKLPDFFTSPAPRGIPRTPLKCGWLGLWPTLWSLGTGEQIVALRGATKGAERASKAHSKHSTHSKQSNTVGGHCVCFPLLGQEGFEKRQGEPGHDQPWALPVNRKKIENCH